jgi:hypothetical protein
MLHYADIYFLLNYCTCFGRPSRPSSGVHETVVAASDTDFTVWGARFFKRDQINVHVFIITNTMHTIGVDKITLFKTT